MADLFLHLCKTQMNAVAKDKCPFGHMGGGGASNRDWWPNQLRVDLLHQHSSKSDPMRSGFNYAEAFKCLDYQALQCGGK